jgi:hypothetical protein
LELQFWFRDENGEEEFKMWRFGIEQEQQQVRCMVEEVMKAGVGYRRYCRLWSGAGRGGGAGGGGKEQSAAAAATATDGRPHHEDEVSSSSCGTDPVEELPRPFRNLTVSRVVIVVSTRGRQGGSE